MLGIQFNFGTVPCRAPGQKNRPCCKRRATTRANVVPARMSMGSVASQMESMRIIATGLAVMQNTPPHFLPANFQRLHLVNEALRFGSWREEFDAPLPVAMPCPG